MVVVVMLLKALNHLSYLRVLFFLLLLKNLIYTLLEVLINLISQIENYTVRGTFASQSESDSMKCLALFNDASEWQISGKMEKIENMEIQYDLCVCVFFFSFPSKFTTSRPIIINKILFC